MSNQDHCQCQKLEQKITQHEEVITQLLHMMASMNQAVTQLVDKQKAAVGKSLQQVPSTLVSSH